MRKTISGMVAAVAVMMTASAAPAMACGGGLFTSCSPCAYAVPCAPAPVYVAPAPAPVYSGCYTGCGGWAHERLPDPVHQYYYVNQGPTYTGPGNWAPRPVYQEDALPVYRHRSHHYGYRAHRHYGYHHAVRPSVRYGYAPRYGMPRHGMMSRHGMHHGGAMMMPRHHGHQGHRNHVRRYY